MIKEHLQGLFLVLFAVVAVVSAAGTSDAQPPAVGIEAFYGTFSGRGVSMSGGEAAPRDLSVTIAPGPESGFVVSWMTVVRSGDGEETRKDYNIAFRPTQRSGVYRSAMRANVFGEQVPLDPFTGDPFVWARLAGRTLTVYALIILADGGYDLQIYERTLSEQGLDLVFSRWVDGEKVTSLHAQLERKSK